MNKKQAVIVILTLIQIGCCPSVVNSGPAGPQGLQGSQGTKGDTGVSGISCTVESVAASEVAPNGGSLIQCPDGSQSLVLNGTNGENGAAGTPGTLVTSVQFCPNDTPSYPSSFPEVGFCIDDNLYAVYSANGGFMTKILPGNWTSNAVGSSCNFTVSANCTVTRN